MSKKVTFKEVAALAGVSTQTVSRVTNGGDNVNSETLKKVQAAIDTLGYVPNKGAQLLVRKKAKIFGVISLEMTMEGAMNIVEGIRLESKKEGYSISISVLENGEDSLEQTIRELLSQQVDAILINLAVTKNMAESIVKKYAHIPFLFIDVPVEAHVNQVSANHYDGASKMAKLLLSQGHSRFALLNGPANSWAANQRKLAWENEIKKENAKIVLQAEGDWSAKSGYLETTKMLLQPIQIDALLVVSDQMALGALRACSEQKKAVPQQIVVSGFDDTADSAYFNPPLTTVKQNFLEIGKQAVQQVLLQLNDDTLISKQFIDVELVERQSTMLIEKESNAVQKIENLLQEIQSILPSIPEK
ncbi:DNA-binding LacI/PurR family transcriptional regulator [Wenyingzhuangia heitensis]|uniref:DNA-binding LacI/PurR family transcriptional regulator n=1 Tax=Wenyingzhuangia heitensis TaxID=1487859 RepID=A0ABX0U9X1_9FLAO|nr:LacI family DNA-binding transcriptional regulator [Wenyingzhuangia heitensis]NIJ45629.1 DNA-binding LacI/PurR family transcriptional regulator [Wenyingzhuangia heitensis]